MVAVKECYSTRERENEKLQINAIYTILLSMNK